MKNFPGHAWGMDATLPGQPGRVWTLAALVIGTAIFVAPLLLPIVPSAWLALQFPDVMVLTCLLLATVAAFAGRASSDPRLLATLAALSLGVFGFALGAKWWSGLSSDILQFGLLPSLDSESYVAHAIQLLNVGKLGEFASRRPLAPSQLAGLFLLDGVDLRLTMALLVAACAVASLGILSAIRHSFGLPAAFAAMAVLFSFIYPTLGTAMTESVGYILGAAAFVLLWHGGAQGKPWWALTGIAFFSVGVLTRAGALFVLPALAYWVGRRFGTANRISVGWAIAALAAGCVGFMANAMLVVWLAAPGQVPFANFASTFYGLVAAGKSWDHVYSLHPELWTLSDGDQARTLYRMAADHLAAHPFDLVRGILYRYNDFLFNVEWHKYVPNSGLRMVVLMLALVGLASAWRRRHHPSGALMLAAFSGIFLSVPFLGDGGPRVFAASHAFTAAFVACGAAAVHRRFGRAQADARGAPTGGVWAMPAVIAMFVAVPLLALAFTAPTGSLRPPSEAPSCGEGQIAAHGQTLANGAVTVCPAGADSSCRGVSAASVAATDIWHSSRIAQVVAAEHPIAVFMVIVGDQKAERVLTIVSDPSGVMKAGGVAACVTPKGELAELVR